MTSLPPALILLLAAPVVALVRGRARAAVGIVAPLLALVASWYLLGAEPGPVLSFLGESVRPVAVHPLTGVFAVIFCLMAAGGALFLANRDRPVELAGAMVYAGGALGVCFAGDWLSLFAFWEIMTLGSTTIIFSAGTVRSFGAGMRYFVLHAIGGVVLLAGIVWLLQLPGTSALIDQPLGYLATAINHGGPASGAAWLILIGLLINAGAPPLWSWIADAYPAASETGTVFLSAFTTKVAVFVLVLAFAGSQILVYLGITMAVYGIVYAAREDDIRRILAYAIVNQVGFMLCGAGLGSELAIAGVGAQAFAHIGYKALLLMVAGAVIQATGKQRFSELGGLHRAMPVTMWCCIVGVLAISSVPGTSGYTTKYLIMEATAERVATLADQGGFHRHLTWAWLVMKGCSTALMLVVGLRFLWGIFFAPARDLEPAATPLNMHVAMVAFAALCLVLGLYPGPLYTLLPYSEAARELGQGGYQWYHIAKSLGLLALMVTAFALLLPVLERKRTITLDVDWLYRRLVPLIWRALLLPFLRQLGRVHGLVVECLPGAVATRVRDGFGGAARISEWAVGATVVLVTLMLCFYLLVQYLARWGIT